MYALIFYLISSTFIYNLIAKEQFLNPSYAINEGRSDSVIINLQQRSGGFMYSPPNCYTIESNMLSNDESKKLNDLISNSNFYNLKNESLPSKRGDMYVYDITIENKDKSQSLVNNTELSSTKELNDLRTFVMDLRFETICKDVHNK